MKFGWGFLKWVLLFGMEAGSIALMNKDSSIDLRNVDSVKAIMEKLLATQEHQSATMRMFFFSILALIALEIIYLLCMTTKRCLKKDGASRSN